MKTFASCLPLAGALFLAACGGGGGGTPAAMQAGVAVGEPAPGPTVDKAAFIKMAQEGACSDRVNRLYVIDGKQVFWETAGACADASYSYSLFGAAPDQLQCTSADSIAGPRVTCKDESQRALLETITKNLDKEDLGLGTAHKLELVPFMRKDGALAFDKLLGDDYTGIKAAQNLVIRDQQSFASVWAQAYQNRTPAPELPKVDFRRQMVLAVFAGEQPTGCRLVNIEKVGISGGVLVVAYRIDQLQTYAVCTQAFTSPVSMVVVERMDGRVEFVGS